ncbi:MAG: ATP-binding protein [Chlorobi bacterium]|nr:ATP-binding protein [Chlorobiota bacterium]
METVKNNFTMNNSKELILHSFIGVLIGYFFLHPVSMAIHWFEMNNSDFTLAELGRVFSESIIHSFSLHMMPMSIAFSVLGAVIGFGSGLYYTSIKKKNRALYGKKQLLQQSIPIMINEGENEFVEFKSSLRHDYRQVKTDKNLEHVIIKSIAGFLNAKGGTLLIGVNDFGEILGIENDYMTLKKKNRDGFYQRLVLLVSNAFGKDVFSKIHVTFHELENKDICSLFIEPSTKPAFVKEGNRTAFYLRTGNVTNPLTTLEVVEYIQSRNIN